MLFYMILHDFKKNSIFIFLKKLPAIDARKRHFFMLFIIFFYIYVKFFYNFTILHAQETSCDIPIWLPACWALFWGGIICWHSQKRTDYSGPL